MNDHWQQWKHILDIRHARVLQTHNVLDHLDVAFVEGALTSQDHIDRVKEIREHSEILVAIGACAAIGLPSAQRNQFDAKRLEEIQPILARFQYLEKVKRLADVVKVDITIPGCPMDGATFLKALDQLLNTFNIPLPHAPS